MVGAAGAGSGGEGQRVARGRVRVLKTFSIVDGGGMGGGGIVASVCVPHTDTPTGEGRGGVCVAGVGGGGRSGGEGVVADSVLPLSARAMYHAPGMTSRSLLLRITGLFYRNTRSLLSLPAPAFYPFQENRLTLTND